MTSTMFGSSSTTSTRWGAAVWSMACSVGAVPGSSLGGGWEPRLEEPAQGVRPAVARTAAAMRSSLGMAACSSSLA